MIVDLGVKFVMQVPLIGNIEVSLYDENTK